MHHGLREEYIKALFRLRKFPLEMPKPTDVNITELMVMVGISDQMACGESKMNLTEIQHHTNISKAAMSQIFTSLEKKGYVVRGIDPRNRRKITVALTNSGTTVLERVKKQVDQLLDEIFVRLGEEKVRQIILLLNELSDISDAIRLEKH